MSITLVAARSENGVIGRKGEIPWHLPRDLKFFKELTTGHVIIMGRKTFASVGKPLPNRHTIVLTRDKSFAVDGVTVSHNPEELFSQAKTGELITPEFPEEREVFVVGGEDIYRMALPYADRMHLTLVHTGIDGNVSFPPFSEEEWALINSERHESDDRNPFDMTFETWERR